MLRLRPLMPLTLLALAVLAGCGGGGGDTSTVSSGETTLVTADPITVQGATCGHANFQAELLQRINALRAAGADCGTDTKTGRVYGVFAATTALAWNDKLTTAAQGHSADMQAREFFDHTNPDGVTMSQRVSAAGYTWSTVAENIAAGYGSVEEVMTGWRNSPGHCANLMNPDVKDVGVACVTGTASNNYGNYWTMDLATPQ